MALSRISYGDCTERGDPLLKKVFSAFLALITVFVLVFTPYASAASGDRTVYITKTGKCYHEEYCSYLKSSIETTLSEAVSQGYSPCSKCRPPKLDSNSTSSQSSKSSTAKTSTAKSTTSVQETSDTVWIPASGKKYHSINNCGNMNPQKAKSVTVDYATSHGYSKCSKCWWGESRI